MIAELQPMLCLSQALTSTAEVNAEDRTAEEKFDGWRVIVWVTPERQIRVYGGRNGHQYNGRVTYIERSLLACLPPDTVVDGEMTAPAELGFGYVQSNMSAQQEHRITAMSPPLTYRIFDVLRIAGKDVRQLPWHLRRALVEKIQIGEHVAINPLLPLCDASYATVIARGGEGLVLKHRASRYRNDARAREWRKLKHTLEVSARVVGFKPGTEGSSWEGLVGAIEFELLDTGVRSRCSGFDMDLRLAMTAHPEAYIGRIFDLKMFPGVGKDGKPRSPNFLRWRDDLLPDPPADWLARHSTNGSITRLKQAKTLEHRAAPRKVASVNQPARPRNYASMNLGKLRRSIAELEAGEGEAYEKCVARGHDPSTDLDRARAALRQKEGSDA